MKADKAGTSAEGPTKADKAIAAQYGFSLPPLGGEPESMPLKGIEIFRKNNSHLLRKAEPYDH